jgi:hypothetical protein
VPGGTFELFASVRMRPGAVTTRLQRNFLASGH